MVVKTVTYTDFDGNERTEDFRFNFTEAELTEMEMSLNGGLSQLLDKIVKENDNKQLIEYFKKLVIGAYGVKSLDGKVFDKSEEIKKNFANSAAYSKIFMELATNADAAAEFVNGIIPKSISEKVEKPAALPGKAPVEVVKPSN
jgi:hypothetical protein